MAERNYLRDEGPLPQAALDMLSWVDGKDRYIEELELALAPFVEAARFYTANTENDYHLKVKGADIRRARRALDPEEESRV